MDMLKKISIAVILSALALMIFAGCEKRTFNGSSTGNDEEFIIDYSIMNCTKTNEMKLKEGTKVNVVIENKSGKLDILITNSNGEKIYKGDNVSSSKFSIEILKEDTYKVSVTGENAKGNVSFKADK